MAVQKLPGGSLAPSSQNATNMMVDAGHKEDMSLPGSPSSTPMPGDSDYDASNQVLRLPMPVMDGPVQPVNPQAGEHGGEGLPTEPTRAEFAKAWTTGIQPGGNQGGAGGDSGPDLWKPTPSSS